MAFKFDKDKIQESTDFFERWLGPKPASSQPEVDIHQLRNVPLANLLTNTFLQDHTAYASQADLAAQLGLVDIEALKDWPKLPPRLPLSNNFFAEIFINQHAP